MQKQLESGRVRALGFFYASFKAWLYMLICRSLALKFGKCGFVNEFASTLYERQQFFCWQLWRYRLVVAALTKCCQCAYSL